jgi:hypothetical protein
MSIIITHQEEKLEALKGQLAYVNEALAHELENWERKEYLVIKSEYETQIEQLQSVINAAKLRN